MELRNQENEKRLYQKQQNEALLLANAYTYLSVYKFREAKASSLQLFLFSSFSYGYLYWVARYAIFYSLQC